MTSFNDIHDSIVKNDKFVKLNKMYEMDMMNFNQEHAIFHKDDESQSFRVQISYNSEFDLRLKRIYFCNLRAFIFNMKQFSYTMKLVDLE